MYLPHIFNLFIHWWTFRLLPPFGFCEWYFVNNAAVNTGVHISVRVPDFVSFDIYPEVELLDHMVIVCLIFLRNLCTVFCNGFTKLHPHQQYIMHSSLFSTSLSTLVIFCLFGNSHLNKCEVISYCDLDLHFPDD